MKFYSKERGGRVSAGSPFLLRVVGWWRTRSAMCGTFEFFSWYLLVGGLERTGLRRCTVLDVFLKNWLRGLFNFFFNERRCCVESGRGRRGTHTDKHTTLLCSLSLFIPSPLVRSLLSLFFSFPSHFSVLTIQFMTMNAGELLANSLSAGKPLCFPVLWPSRVSASRIPPLPSALQFQFSSFPSFSPRSGYA